MSVDHGAITCPTLICWWGGDDACMPKTAACRLKQMVSGQVRIQIIPICGHYVPEDLHRNLLIRCMIL